MYTNNSSYWEQRYQHKDTPWNLDRPHPAIVDFFEQLKDRDLTILVPGAGYGHEAEWLWHKGFNNIVLCDWAASALQGFKNRVNDFPDSQLLHRNFFELERAFDLILEHTFFCALPPEMRANYAEHTAALLRPQQGILTGVLFGEDLGAEGPPYGGSDAEYLNLFNQYYDQVDIEEISPNHSPRSARELFIYAKFC